MFPERIDKKRDEIWDYGVNGIATEFHHDINRCKLDTFIKYYWTYYDQTRRDLVNIIDYLNDEP